MLSLVNTALRDGDDLCGFCARYGAEEEELTKRLADAGYAFDDESYSFKRV